ncbi:unnamed protein product [Malus baccata var. baccata]
MDILYNSAPELVWLLSELYDAHEELEGKVTPLLGKVLFFLFSSFLLSYCQAITFYLLLKSEGQPVRDHPVLARLIEIKILFDKMKQLDGNLPYDFEEILNKYNWVAAVAKSGKETSIDASDSFSKEYGPQPVLVEGEAAAVNDEVGVQSMRILKVRAALVERLKQKGVFSSIAPKIDKPRKLLKPLNGKLDSYDDFDDDTVNIEGAVRGLNNGRASKLSQLAANPIKSKVISGNDDLPRRDDIGERRRKHELRVLAGAGIKSQADARATISDAGDVEMEDSETGDSKDGFYEQLKRQKAVKNRKGQVREVRKPLGGINAGISRSTRRKEGKGEERTCTKVHASILFNPLRFEIEE